jgi:membrane-associated protein
MMQAIEWVIDLIRNPGALIEWGGYPGLAAIIFLETGALVFFLPGDSLLVMAGLYAAKGDLNILALNVLLIPCAIIGDALSYQIGKRAGPMIFNRPKSRFFDPKHMKTAHEFYERHGGKAIIIARFMPILRTFVPVVAGVAQMGYRKFAAYNIIGGASWILSMTLLGYVLGVQFPQLGKHVEKVILVIVLLSISPGIYAWVKMKLDARKNPTAGEPS